MPSMPSQEENPCPGCMGPLKDAVTGTCGHIFSQSRLLPPSQMGAQPSCQVLLCVLCKEKEPTKPLVVPVPLGPLGETCCEEHGEKVYFFCKTDAEFLCVACREGPSHRTHTVGVLDGAAQPYWDHFRSQMEARSLEKKQMEGTRRRENEKLQELLTHMDGKKQQVDEAFRRLRQELADHQCLLQARLRKLEQQIRVEGEAYTSTLSEEIAGLGAQVQALGEQLQRPVSALLQDVRANPSRYETKTFVTPETISPDLVKKIRDLHGKILPLPEMLRTFSGTRTGPSVQAGLPSGMPVGKNKSHDFLFVFLRNLAHYLDTDSGRFPCLRTGLLALLVPFISPLLPIPALPSDWQGRELSQSNSPVPGAQSAAAQSVVEVRDLGQAQDDIRGRELTPSTTEDTELIIFTMTMRPLPPVSRAHRRLFVEGSRDRLGGAPRAVRKERWNVPRYGPDFMDASIQGTPAHALTEGGTCVLRGLVMTVGDGKRHKCARKLRVMGSRHEDVFERSKSLRAGLPLSQPEASGRPRPPGNQRRSPAKAGENGEDAQSHHQEISNAPRTERSWTPRQRPKQQLAGPVRKRLGYEKDVSGEAGKHSSGNRKAEPRSALGLCTDRGHGPRAALTAQRTTGSCGKPMTGEDAGL
ncbi:hypothetical protein PANDA_020621 [Ailuropoda melanoleuca]|uniref:B box-type domain-containing protein n=1 Tax=Ailuropoda melanoleuca TaxID=9646 RepID=D2I4S1_AILME|nr:hypothetical protein PANDA_020621 [Ailuropoda melanoleuca]